VLRQTGLAHVFRHQAVNVSHIDAFVDLEYIRKESSELPVKTTEEDFLTSLRPPSCFFNR